MLVGFSNLILPEGLQVAVKPRGDRSTPAVDFAENQSSAIEKTDSFDENNSHKHQRSILFSFVFFFLFDTR